MLYSWKPTIREDTVRHCFLFLRYVDTVSQLAPIKLQLYINTGTKLRWVSVASQGLDISTISWWSKREFRWRHVLNTFLQYYPSSFLFAYFQTLIVTCETYDVCKSCRQFSAGYSNNRVARRDLNCYIYYYLVGVLLILCVRRHFVTRTLFGCIGTTIANFTF